jgi:hypothetical protein
MYSLADVYHMVTLSGGYEEMKRLIRLVKLKKLDFRSEYSRKWTRKNL